MLLVKHPRLKVFSILLFVYIAPVAAILTGLISFAHRFLALGIVFLVVFAIAKLDKCSLQELGLKFGNIRQAIWHIVPVTLALSIGMLGYFLLHGARIDNSGIQAVFYLIFSMFSVPVQEFLYRSYLFNLLPGAGLSRTQQIAISAILYSFLHAIYWDIPTLLLTLAIGLVWGHHYSRFYNLYSVSLSHAVLGIVAISTGLI